MTFCFSARQDRSDRVDLVRLVRLRSVIELIELTEKFYFSYVRLPKQPNNNFLFGFVGLTTPAVISSYPHTAKCSKSQVPVAQKLDSAVEKDKSLSSG